MTASSYLNRARVFFERHGIDSARIDAELLLCAVLNTDRLGLLMDLDRPLEKEEVDAYRELIRRRGCHEPVAYLLGYKDFYGHRFKVSDAVLIPRPETELLVDLAVQWVTERDWSAFVDFGCGSGAIGLSILHACPNSHAHLIDISEPAIGVAQHNAHILGVADRAEMVCADMCDVISGMDGLPDAPLWLSNPPYIPCEEEGLVSHETIKFEPSNALFAEGERGLYFFERLANGWHSHDCAQAIIVEHGFSQGAEVDALFMRPGVRRTVLHDFDGHQRIRGYQKAVTT